MSKKFKIDARTLLAIGRDSIKDHTTAVVELVKNAYDADAGRVEIDFRIAGYANLGLLRIADNGEGMSEKDIEQNWLRIGYSEKRNKPTTKDKKRRKTGEKGIGRLSADRLGAQLHLRSKKKGSKASGLMVDWTKFDADARDLSDIEIEESPDPTPEIPLLSDKPAPTGTELLISNLRQTWTVDDIVRLRSELSLLISPYSEQAKDFQIELTTDVDPSQNGEISSNFVSNAEIDIDARLSLSGDLAYTLTYHSGPNRTVKKKKGIVSWTQIEVGKSKGKKPRCGAARVRLSFFPQKADLLEGSDLRLSDLKKFLQNSGGVRIYRDMVRVKPYGDPDSENGDWLGLAKRRISNPVGRASKLFKIAPNQLVGAIFISRDTNAMLVDSSSREGLIEDDAFKELRAVALTALSLVEAKYHETSSISDTDSTTKAAKAKRQITSLRADLSNLRSELREFKDTPSSGHGRTAVPLEALEEVLEKIENAEREIDEIASQNTVLRGLATVGIASAVFGHETESASDAACMQLVLARELLKQKPPEVTDAGAAIGKGEEALERVAAWGRFALGRVKRDKRQRKITNIKTLVGGVLDELKNPLKENSISLELKLADVSAKTIAMDVEAILVNLITNAYHAVGQVRAKRRICVQLAAKTVDRRSGFQLDVEDSGPGIPKELESAIWQPLYSTKKDAAGRQVGTGLGLTIVKSIVEELRGTIEVKRKGPLGGASISLWLPA